jgi:protein-S-isoprenylcysteine O-methyltransferase Ste14
MTKRVAVLAYGILSYAMFHATFLYFIGFLGNIAVPRSVDAAPTMPLVTALLINIGLIALFSIQHSVMARPGFKRVWKRIVPDAVERSTYCIFSCVALGVLFYFWQPIGGQIWDVQNPMARAVLYGLFASGWLIVVGSSFAINHFDLFGLRQTWMYFKGVEYKPLPFATPGPYRHVRHPLYVGWFLAFWATPTMTITHLVFALGMTAYILAAIRYEERDLVAFHGHAYAEYRKRTPKFIPKIGTQSDKQEAVTES